MALTKVPNELSSTPSIVDGGNATAISIDSSENILFNTSATDTAATGFRFRAGLNAISSVSDGGISAYLGRRTSDGDILAFRKDDNIIGSIGASGGDLVIGTGDTGIHFHDSVDSLIPWNVATAGYRDAAIDLGTSNYRFKDLYLSGGVNFSANANASGMTSEVLDDYEEGSWTPALSSGTMGNVGVSRYTKVGRLVTCYTQMDTFSDVSSGTAFEISGLPFTADLGNRATTLGILASRISNIGAITGGYLNTASPPKLLLYNTSASSFRNLVHSDFSANNSMYISFTYFSN